jgi:hypothetical protein
MSKSSKLIKTFRPDSSNKDSEYRKRIATIEDPKEFEQEWNKNEGIINKYLDQREEINDATARVFQKQNGFGNFWKKQCEMIAKAALLLFYTGTLLVLISITLISRDNYVNKYNSSRGGYLSAVCLVFGMILGMYTVIKFRYENHYVLNICKK